MELRALGVSSTLAFVGHERGRGFMSENCSKWGEEGSPPHAATLSLGREGVTFTNSTEAFLKGFHQSRFFSPMLNPTENCYRKKKNFIS